MLVVLCASPAARAQALSFDEAIALTLRAPEVDGAADVLRTREAEDGHIGRQTGNPTLWLQPGMRVVPSEDRGFEGQVQLTQSWNLAGLGKARQRSAAAERRALAVQLRAAALYQRLHAATAWLDLYTTTRARALADRVLSVAQERVGSVTRAVEVGVTTREALLEAEADAAVAEGLRLRLEGEHVEARHALAEAIGRADATQLSPAGDPPEPELPEMNELAERLGRAERLPAAAAARLELVAERSRVIEVAATNGTLLQAGAQVQRESPNGFIAYGVFSVTFPVFALNARQVSEAKAEATRRLAAYRKASQSARRQVLHVLHEVEHTRQQEALLRSKAVPALARLTERLEKAASLGEATVFELLDAERRLRAAELDGIRAEGARRSAELRAWLLLAAIEAPASAEGRDAP